MIFAFDLQITSHFEGKQYIIAGLDGKRKTIGGL